MTGMPADAHAMLAGTVRRFMRREVWLWEKRIDANAFALPAEVAADLASKVAEMGLSLVREAEDLGGPTLGWRERALVVEEMAQHRAGVLAPGYGLFGPEVPPALYAADAAQRSHFLLPLLRGEQACFAELNTVSIDSLPGSDRVGATEARAGGVRIRARQRNGGWMLDGTKLFVSGAGRAPAGTSARTGFGVVTARTESATGEALGVSRFLVETDRPGFQRWRAYPTLALGRDTQELNLSNVQLPAENELKAGGRLVREAIVRRDVFVAAGLVGVGRAALAIERERARGGGGGESGRWSVADGGTLIAAARGLVREAAGPAWTLGSGFGDEDRADGQTGRSGAEEEATASAASDAAVQAGAAQARLAAQEAAARVVDTAIMAMGAAGLSADLPLERWLRELRVLRESDGGASRLRETAANYLLSTYAP